jgi:hypothetical protein
MANQNSPVIFTMPGYNPPGDTFITPEDGSENMGTPSASAYKIPPVVWPVIFIITAYIGLRFIME